jgi:hypothetical protein
LASVAALASSSNLRNRSTSFLPCPLGREAGCQRLELLAYGEQVAYGGLVERRHHRTTARQDLDEALRLDDAQCLADRVAGDPEVVGQPGLGQPLPLGVVPVHDPPAELREDLLAQSDMVGTDRPHLTHVVHPIVSSPPRTLFAAR